MVDSRGAGVPERVCRSAGLAYDDQPGAEQYRGAGDECGLAAMDPGLARLERPDEQVEPPRIDRLVERLADEPRHRLRRQCQPPLRRVVV
ncbi:MAG: hypothetical protein HND58_04530 [Planctomycetota bacterium]|nr:MAG: hypothetical protein HND58_04530 [Planctomycetota bacterium]